MEKGRMKLEPVYLDALSDISYQVQLPVEESGLPEFMHFAFRGAYRDGAEGKTDAQYITAIVAAHDAVWQTNAFIIDLSELVYQWGDEMHCIWDIGYERWCRCHRPLAIIVSEKCSPALKTLDQQEYERFAVQSFEEALSSIRRQKPIYDRCVREGYFSS